MTKRWTKDEDEILKEKYPNLGKFGCVEHLPNRSPEAIAKRARNLSVTHSMMWTNEQVSVIEQFYSDYGAEYCAKLINKDPKSIVAKANRLGIKMVNPNGKWTHKDYEMALMEAEAEAYPLEEYKGYGVAILHGCINGHSWRTRPNTILSYNAGCPECSDSSFKLDKPAIFYYIKICKENKIYYKVGITNRTLKQRFPTSIKFITILKETHFKTGKEALEQEKVILSQYKDKRVTISDFLAEGGNTELFEEDVLNLDK